MRPPVWKAIGSGRTTASSPWLPDTAGRHWSETLGLFLLVNGALVQAQTPDGELLLTPEQVGVALRDSELARRQSDNALYAAEIARQRSADELAELRREIMRLRGESEE